jgi:predicted PurR-regulated permease PerM
MARGSSDESGHGEAPRSGAGVPRWVGRSEEPEEPPVAEAETAAESLRTTEHPLGRPGRPLDRRSPFFVGMTAAAGVAVTYGVVQLIIAVREVLLLIGLAFFVAMGFEPAVSWLVRHRMPRWAAVSCVVLIAVGMVAGFLAAAIPALSAQTGQFTQQLPGYVSSMQDPNTLLGQLNTRFGIQDRVQQLLSGRTETLAQGLLGAGRLLLGAISGSVVVAVLFVYFLATMPRIRRALYRLVPAERRPRAVLIGDEVFFRVGGYVLGNVITSLIAGLATFVWLVIFGVPYPLLLASLVAILDLVPIVGTVLAAIVVSLVSLTVSVPVALATVAYFLVYRFLEDYLLVPKIIGRTVRVPAVVTVLAVLVGGTLLGVIGALIAIPVAAVVLLLVQELALPRLDRQQDEKRSTGNDWRGNTAG